MFLCRHCIRVYDGVAVSQSDGPCEVCDRLDTCSDVPRYRRKSDLETSREIERLRAVLDTTHTLVTEGALVGFIPTEGTWAERLYTNQGRIHDALKQK